MQPLLEHVLQQLKDSREKNENKKPFSAEKKKLTK